MTSFCREDHNMTRINIVSGMGFDKFVAAFEEAVPQFDAEAMQRIVTAGGSWDDVRARSHTTPPTS